MKNLFILKKVLGLSVLFLLFLSVTNCTQEPELWKVSSQEQVISDFVLSNTNQYAEFGKLLVNAGLTDLLSVRGPYTLFLPTDDAMKAYYAAKGYSSLSDMPVQEQKTLAKNHLIVSEIHSGDILVGALRDTNAIGDYLVTEFSGSDIIINKHSKITKRDIICANGYVHEIDQVIEPVTQNIYDLIASNPSYSLFAKGLKLTKLSDTLQTVQFQYGKKNVRTRFTVLAVPDTVFNRYGIYTADNLVAYFTNRPDSITYLQNGFYRYMEYHCMANTYYLSGLDLGTKLYPILSFDNNISITVDTDYKINPDRVTKKYTGFILDASNIPAKNGALHTVNDLLPVTQPIPVIFVFDTTDYPEFKQGDFYGKYYMKWHTWEGVFTKIKFEGDYLQYYWKLAELSNPELNQDCLNMNGFWWVEITTPKIMKGSYKLSGYIWSGNIDFEVYVDGIKSAFVKKTDSDRAPWGEFTWTKTQEHKIKIVNLTWGMLFWDTVIFTPIIEY